MPTSKEYRLQAKDCLELASRPLEPYVKTMLLALATEFNDAAEELERRERTPARPKVRPASRLRRGHQ